MDNDPSRQAIRNRTSSIATSLLLLLLFVVVVIGMWVVVLVVVEERRRPNRSAFVHLEDDRDGGDGSDG